MVVAQGGDLTVPCVDRCHDTVKVKATKSGVVSGCDAYKIGYANVLLVAGEQHQRRKFINGVGIRLHHKKDEMSSVQGMFWRKCL